MKLFLKFILLSAMAISFTGCQKNNDISIYQLSNQSYSQMMSYIIEDEGTTIVVDGGTAEDEENLIQTIKKVSKDRKVEAWFLTHYHKDHTGALAKYLQSGSNEIKIDKIYYNFPEESWVESYEPNRYDDVAAIDEGLKTFKNKEVVSLNQKINVINDKIHVLRTYNPEITNNAGNNSSSVYKMDVHGNKILFLGDLGVEGGEELLSLNKEAIKNMDYVQMAHHGQAGVDEDVYQVIDPKYCMWPTPDWLWDYKGETYKTEQTKKWIKALHVKKNYVADKGTIRIELKKKED